MIITAQTWISVCCSSSFRRMFSEWLPWDFSMSLKLAGQHEPFLHQLPTPCLAAKQNAFSNGISLREPEVSRHCIGRRRKAMTPPWSGSWLPVPTSMRRTTMAVASELEESTRILHKSVGIWPQNIDIFEGKEFVEID